MCYAAISEVDEAALTAKFAVMRRFLDERGWRVYLGTGARALGYGGIAAVARAAGASETAAGASETTVAGGAAEAADPEALTALAPSRSRRPGAGRPKAEDAPGLKEALDGLLEEGKRGDPMSAVTWNILSLRDTARQMILLGFSCSKDTIARLMHQDGYSLQGMSRVLEGKQHQDRDAQFRHINAKIEAYRELLAAARITLPGTPPPERLPRTPGELLAHAAAAGIPLTLPENGPTMPEHFRTRKTRTTRDTPETAN